MIRNIVFDMGGVLYRFYPSEAMAAYPPEDRELLHGAIFGHPDWILQDRGDIDEEEMIRRALTRVPERLAADAERLVRWYELTGPVEGMEALAAELFRAGYPLYLLSNVGYAYHRFRDRIPAAKHLRGEFLSAEHHLLKPHREIYDAFVSEFSLVPEECLFIDDWAPNIEGAKAAGWDGIVFSDAAALREELSLRGILPDPGSKE